MRGGDDEHERNETQNQTQRNTLNARRSCKKRQDNGDKLSAI